MDKFDYKGKENHSKAYDKPSCLRRSRTTAPCVCEKPSPSSMDALRESGEQNSTAAMPFSESFPNTNPAFKTTLTSALHGRSNFVPMDPRSLGASIKREENRSQRSRSPSRKPRRLKSIRLSICEPSTMTDEADANRALSQGDDLSFSGDFDELGASDEEGSKRFLLGVSTPTTLRRKKFRLSLHPVHESHDEVMKENCASDAENN